MIDESVKGMLFGLVGTMLMFSVVLTAAFLQVGACATESYEPGDPVETTPTPTIGAPSTPTPAPVYERPCKRWQVRGVTLSTWTRTLPPGWEPVPMGLGGIGTSAMGIARCIEAAPEPLPERTWR